MTDTSGDTPVAVAAEAAVLAPATTETGGGHAPLSSSAGNSGGVNNGGSWSRAELRRLKDGLTEELTGERASQLQKDEATIYQLQDRINGLNEERHAKSLELRNVDRKINFLVQSRLQKDARKEERDKETWFEFFDQSASQDNPLGLKKSDYSAFLYLLRSEAQILGKALMTVPYGEMDYVVQILNFSLFPDLFQAREEILLLELSKQIIWNQVNLSNTPQDMFRQNSFVTKLLGGYTKRHYGRTHLIQCLKEVITVFINEAKDEGTFELRPDAIYKAITNDPATKADEEIENYPGVKERQLKAKERVESYAFKVLQSIKDSLPSMPFGMRYICKQMVAMAAKKFDLNDKQKFTLVSSFIILRYFNPAILVPEAFGLSDRDAGGGVRRSLTLLTKLLQNYANEIVFGGKEAFMAVFNDSRDKGVQIMKDYCFSVTEVPEPNEYYATVVNLPQRKEDMSIFHNTTITMSPNELYTIHKLIESNKADVVPPYHPIGFFLGRLAPVPEKVPRADDKFFTIQLAGGDDDEGDDAPPKDSSKLVRLAAAAVAAVLALLTPQEAEEAPAELEQTSHRLAPWLAGLAAAHPECKKQFDAAAKAIAKLPADLRNDATILSETDKFLMHRESYRSSLAKERGEMEKSIATLESEVNGKSEDLKLWSMYVENIVQSSFKGKIASKREYQEDMKIGPFEYSLSALDKAGCFVTVNNLDVSMRKHASFAFTSSDAGVVEMVIKVDKKPSKPFKLSVLTLLDLLVTQDHIKIDIFLFDIRGLCAFLNGEICS